MSPSLAVLLPVLERPHRVRPLLSSLAASTVEERRAGWAVTALFLVSPDDRAEREAIAAIQADELELLELVVPARSGRGDYPVKINTGAQHLVDRDWFFTGADDLDFHPGWLREAISAHIATGCLVIGTNDLANPSVIAGRHATHSLVHRDYLALGTIDEPGKLLHEGYDHNSCDVEFTQTAQAREEWVFAEKSSVRHLHPIFDRSVKRDAVYNKGLRHAHVDRRLCDSRRHLWDPSAPRISPLGTRHRQSLRMRARTR